MTAKALRQIDLMVAITLAVICAGVTLVVPDHAIRAVCVVPLALICPGYAMTAALFARNRLELPARIMLSLGLSLSILIIGGIVLNSLGGIYKASWEILLLVVILAASAAAVHGRAETDTGPFDFAWRPRRQQVINGLVLSIVLIVAVGAMFASRIPLGAPNTDGYETLSLVQHGDRAVSLTVSSSRQHTRSYRLTVDVAGKLTRTETMTLKPGYSRTLTVTLAPANVVRNVSASLVMLGGNFTPRRAYVALPAA